MSLLPDNNNNNTRLRLRILYIDSKICQNSNKPLKYKHSKGKKNIPQN